MSRRPHLAALALVALLVTAGCSFGAAPDAPVTPESTTATATNATLTDTPAGTGSAPSGPPDVAVRNGSLPDGVDASRTYARVRGVLGVNTTAPAAVRLLNRSALGNRTAARSVPPFWRRMGVAPAPANASLELENGATTAFGTILLAPGSSASTDRTAALLAHEFVHYVQFRTGRLIALNRRLGTATDDRFVVRALLEGVAVLATDAYLARYRPAATPNGALYDRIAAAYPPGSLQRYRNLQYVAGQSYLRARYGDPAAAWEVFGAPPNTSEQVLHATGDPPRPLSVTVRAPGYRPAGRDTLGEAFVRTMLANADPERARRAAAGWGNDTLVRLRADGTRSYVWALRWDDAGNASEFDDALRSHLDARATPDGEGWRLDGCRVELRRQGDVVLLLAGDGPFVNATASVDGPRVRVRVAAGENDTASNATAIGPGRAPGVPAGKPVG